MVFEISPQKTRTHNNSISNNLPHASSILLIDSSILRRGCFLLVDLKCCMFFFLNFNLNLVIIKGHYSYYSERTDLSTIFLPICLVQMAEKLRYIFYYYLRIFFISFNGYYFMLKNVRIAMRFKFD